MARRRRRVLFEDDEAGPVIGPAVVRSEGYAPETLDTRTEAQAPATGPYGPTRKVGEAQDQDNPDTVYGALTRPDSDRVRHTVLRWRDEGMDPHTCAVRRCRRAAEMLWLEAPLCDRCWTDYGDDPVDLARRIGVKL